MSRISQIRFPVFLYIAGFVILALGLAASQAFDIPMRHLLGDPAQITGSEFYVGILSNLTVITWAAGAYVALYTWSLLSRVGAETEWIRFFKLGGLLTLVLMLDDLFMFHESIFPDYLFLPHLTGLNPNEKILFGIYGLFTIYYIYSSRHTFEKTPWIHFAVALGFFATSFLIDRGIGKYLVPNRTARILVEDGSKFLGTIGWSWFYVSVGRQILLSYLPQTSGQKAPESIS